MSYLQVPGIRTWIAFCGPFSTRHLGMGQYNFSRENVPKKTCKMNEKITPFSGTEFHFLFYTELFLQL